MSDNLRRYCAIHSSLKRLLPAEPTGNRARHLSTLAALVSGLIGSRRAHLPAVAGKVPGAGSPRGGGRESRVKRFARLLQNPKVTPQVSFLPYAKALVESLAESLPPGPLALVMDGSQVGRGCVALVLSVLAQQGDRMRALPLCWRVVRAERGHFAQERHRELVEQAGALVPPGRAVVFLGDGEFDGPELLAAVRAAGWHFVCRTARNALLAEADWPGETFTLSALMADGALRPGDCVLEF